MAANATCIICLGQAGPLSEAEKKLKITPKGVQTLIKSCKERQDEVSSRLLPQIEAGEISQINFHFKCRSTYTDSKKIALAVRRRSESPSSCDEPKPKRLSREATSTFSWDDHCFICGEAENLKKNKPLSKVNMRPSEVRQKVLDAALERKDDPVVQRLLYVEDLFAKNARYHRVCYQTYQGKRNIEAHKRKLVASIESSSHDKAATLAYESFREQFQNESVVLLPEICKKYRETLVSLGIDPDVASQTRSFFIKEKLNALFGKEISFYSQRGMPDVVCSNSLTVGTMMKKVHAIIETYENIEYENTLDNDFSNEDELLHKAVRILRTEIDRIPATAEYPATNGVDLEVSEAFVPSSLKKVLQWLFDKRAFDSIDPDYESTDQIKRRYVTLGECLIYCCRRGKNQVIPPFHVGIMAQLQHDYGSRSLIESLSSYGMCGNYDELRAFQTVIAEEQMSRAEDGVYVPPEIIPKTEGGTLIQEGDDNVDINVETVDGKNTYHSMARVLFQEQFLAHSPTEANLKRSTHRSLKNTDTTLLKVLPFAKPLKRPEPPRIPNACQVLEREMAKHRKFSSVKDLTWALLRQIPRGTLPLPAGTETNNQVVPFWTGYNSMIRQDRETSVTVTAYPPIIEAPPSDMSTVYTTLKRGKDLAEKCGQDFHIHTFDQQLYAIAQMVKLSRQEEFPRTVLRLGGFHNLSTFIACIGKIWGDAGLKDMLAESETYATATVESMLQGRQFHRAVRGLTLVFEALTQILVTDFLKWLKEEDHVFDELDGVVLHLYDVYSSFSKSDNVPVQDLNSLSSKIEQELLPQLDTFIEYGSQKSPTFQFWIKFLTSVHIMLANIRAEREGDWDMHLSTQVSMLPYFFIADRQNYSRWGTLYAIEMLTSLPDAVSEAFAEGQFTVRQTPGGFKGVWSDMAVETSIIRDSKSDSGIIGLTRRGSTVLRWTCTRHILGQYSRHMQIRSGLKSSTSKAHEQTKPSMLSRDEQHTQQIVAYIKENMVDPFSVNSHTKLLMNIGTGLVATPEISSALTSAVDKGKDMLNAFVTTRLGDDEDKSFYQPISKSGLKTFKEMKKQTKVMVGGAKKRVNVSAEQVYQRALALAKVRPEVNLATVLSYPLTVVPPSIFKEDGSRRKTNKADLLHALEDTVNNSVTELPCPSVDASIHITDVMAFLRMLKVGQMKTFQDIGEACITKIGQLLKLYTEVHFVFDRYDNEETNPKNEEHQRRQSSGFRQYQVDASRPIPDWNAFMGVSSNKAQLTDFLSTYIEENIQSRELLNPHNVLYLGGGYQNCEKTRCLTSSGSEDIKDLSSSQVEGDTRMILHAVKASEKLSRTSKTARLVVQSPDTDVLVLLVHYFERMKAFTECWMETGTITKILDLRRFIPVHKITVALGPALCDALPSVHALTGCDTVSSFFGIGKKTAFSTARKVVEAELPCLQALEDDKSIDVSRQFVAALYDPKKKFMGSHKSLNELRFRLAAKRTMSIAKLPPCEASFKQHVRRASWQTKTWTTAHIPKPETRQPTSNGWILQESSIVPLYFDGPTALDKLKDFYCGCMGKNMCVEEEKCPCHQDGVACSEICRCEGEEQCQNPNNSSESALEEPDV